MRCEVGDLDGMADLERSLHDAIELDASDAAVAAYVNVADQVWRQRAPRAAHEVQEEAIAFVERRGISTQWVRAESCWMLYDLGDWEELLRAGEQVRAFSREHGRGQPDCIAATYLAHVLVRRGATDAAAAVVDEALPHAREIEDPQVLAPALAVSGLVAEARGDLASARERIDEYDDATRDRPFIRTQNLTDAVRIVAAAGDVARAERLLEGVVTAAERDRLSALTARAAIAEARGDAAGAVAGYDESAAGWRELGCVLEHGLALLGSSRCHLVLDRPDAAAPRLGQAREILGRLQARPLLAAADALSGTAETATAN
jgi:tetratricopeptide (TPR) repeat protein